jgi:excinuclease ABC subunit C
MTVRHPNLELKLQNLPTNPGVYLFLNAKGKPIYIGKAKNLRNRVRTYFQSAGPEAERTRRMVAQVVDLDLIVTENEIESLILEANLVHEHHPRYNILLKDDKHFPYIKITNEPFPRVLVVRRFEKDKAAYFGPYTSSKGMRRTLSFLTGLFKIRTCNFQIPPPPGKELKVCLDYRINRCLGPCEGLQTQESYAEAIKAVKMVLSGHGRQLLEELAAKMHAASSSLHFEDAKALRDQIEALESVMFKQSVDAGEVVDRDIVATARDGNDGVAVVMQIREGILIGRQEFRLAADTVETDSIVVETFLKQYYNHQPNLPDEIYVPHEIPEVRLLESWLRRIKGSKVEIRTPKVGDKTRLLDLAARNASLLLDEVLIQKRQVSERTSKMVTALKDELKLTRSPRRMACFDISNTGESDFVGSCAYFDNGKPLKNQYRHFKIKDATGQDDFTMMRQVVGRYFHRLREEKLVPPDLLVVDGGKGQLSSALAELKSLGFEEQPVIALAKRLEEVYLPGLSGPITIPRGSPALMLLKRIRDEAHRFAVTYNRKVRQKRTITSQLDDIPGIGPARREALLKHFGSVQRIKEATVDEIAAVKGIHRKLAEEVKRVLSQASTSSA